MRFLKWILTDKDPYKSPKVIQIPVRPLGLPKVVVVERKKRGE